MSKTHPLSILIIEDNAGDQLLLHENLMSTMLEIKEIVIANSLANGISHLQTGNFSLLFLDLFLPDSQGLESLTELIRHNFKVPIIIYSGLSDSQLATASISLGAQDFLLKDAFNNSLLEKTVRYCIERNRNLNEVVQSNSRYDLISRATHDMVWDWDLKTNYVYRNNEGWKKIFKVNIDEDISPTEDWTKRIHPEDLKRVQQIIDNAINTITETLFEAEFRILRDDGTIGYLLDRGFIIRDNEFKAIRIIGASQDITDRRSAEEKVSLSEQRFRSLVQNSADLLAILDLNGIYTYVSPTSAKILGFEPEYFIGKSPFEFIHPEDLSVTVNALAEIGSKKYVEVPYFRFRNACDEWRWIESTITNLMDDPAVNGIVVNSRDVTDKKIADDEIEKLSLIARNTQSSVFIMDADRKIQWCNEAFTKITEFTADDAIGKKPSEIFYGVDPDQKQFKDLQSKLKNGLSYQNERYIITKSGKRLWVWLQVQPLFNDHGKVKQYFAVQTDISKQKELEERVKVEKILKQKQITDAVYGAQENERTEIGRELHDNVNQLLGATRMYIDMARRNDESRDSLLNSASDYMRTAIEEIRKLSKTLITPLIKEIGLRDSIKDLAEEIMLVHPIKIKFTSNKFSDQAWNEKFKLNIFRIIQEQTNNIIKHANAQNIILEIKECAEEISLLIRDDGIGFDTSKRKSGVGITNIKSRSELFNGMLTLASEPGKGTSLIIDFKKNNIVEVEKTESNIIKEIY